MDNVKVGWVAMWSGGNSYSAPIRQSDSEYFRTLSIARGEFVNRYNGYANIRPVHWLRDSRAILAGYQTDTRTPAVDHSAYMFLAPLFKDGTVGEWSKLIEYGPRGGVRITDI